MNDRLSQEWLLAKPVIERAVRHGKYTLQEIEDKVLGRRWVLWKQDKSYILTELWDDDFGLVLTICYAAGDMDDVLGMYDNTIEPYANAIGCRKIIALGRSGWKRVMDERGFKDENMISKELR